MRNPALCCWPGSLLALAIWMPVPAVSQTSPSPLAPKTGSLSGTVLDSVSHQPVAYAIIALLPTGPATKPLTSVAANDQGQFTLTRLAAGAYRLQVSFVGYVPRTQAVTVTDGVTTVGAIPLAPATQRLAEAVVLGTKPVVEVRPDRLVYNADQDVTNVGGTAQDVLRKAPLLAVDGDGNLRMRGTSNFKVLVNNRPSPSLARNLAEALRGIPAEQIQRVEVITTPPAKYDGEGTAGIINIVLKKAISPGLNGRLGASGGNRNANFNSALNYKRGKIGFTSSLSAGLRHSPSQTNRERLGFSGQGTDILQQTSVNSNTNRSYYGTLGLDFDPAPHHSFSLAGSAQGYQSTIQQDLLSRDTPPAGTGPGTLFIRPIDNQTGGLNAEGTGTYTRTFAQVRREWSVLGQYALNNGTFGYDFDQYNGSAIILKQAQASYRERSRGRTPSHEVTAQTDYTQPLNSKNTLELGLKAIWRRTGSLADVDTLTPSARPDFTHAPGRSTNFGYAQDVQAAYAT